MSQEFNQISRQSTMTPPPGISMEDYQLMVQKYESVLQSLNHELKSSLDQNKYLQEEISILENNQLKEKRVLEDMRITLEDKEGRINTQLLINEKNELKVENESLSNQILELKLELDASSNENNEIIGANNSLKAVNDKYRDNEYYIQSKYEEVRQKIGGKDILLRQKDEVIFGITRENEALKADIMNLESVENALKNEIDDLVNKRKVLEDINQSLKNQVCEQNIELRRLDSSNNTSIRENQSLVRNIELFKKNTEEILCENNMLKDCLDKFEVHSVDQEIFVQELKYETTQLKAEIDRVRRNRPLSREPLRNSTLNKVHTRDLSYEKIPVQEIERISPKIQRVTPEVPTNSSNFSLNNFKNKGTKSLYDEYLLKVKGNHDPSCPDHQAAHEYQDQQLNYSKLSQENKNREVNEKSFVEFERDEKYVNKDSFEYMTPQKETKQYIQSNNNSKVFVK